MQGRNGADPDEVADCNCRQPLLGKAYAVQGIGGQACRRVTQQVYRDGSGHESIEPADLGGGKIRGECGKKEEAFPRKKGGLTMCKSQSFFLTRFVG